jgi:hypothetical protein
MREIKQIDDKEKPIWRKKIPNRFIGMTHFPDLDDGEYKARYQQLNDNDKYELIHWAVIDSVKATLFYLIVFFLLVIFIIFVYMNGGPIVD